MIEIFHILLGSLIAFGGGAAYLHATREPDDEQPLPSAPGSHLSLVVNRETAPGIRG